MSEMEVAACDSMEMMRARFFIELTLLKLLRDVVCVGDNETKIVDNPVLFHDVVHSVYEIASSKLRRVGLDILRRLSSRTENRKKIFDHPHLVDQLVNTLVRNGHPNDVKEKCLDVLVNLAGAEDIAKRMFDRPGIVGALATSAANGETNGIKERSLLILGVLAKEKDRVGPDDETSA